MAVALVAGALWAWSRDRPVLTGVLIGLGAATKLYPLFLLGPILVVAWRRRQLGGLRRWAAGRRRRGLGAGEPAGLADRVRAVEGVLAVQLRPRRRPRLASGCVLDPRRPRGHAGDDQPVVVGALRRGLRWRWRCSGCARRGRRGWRSSAFLVVAGFLLVNKVYSPQYVLWLLPLAVLARPRWRDLLIWQAGELLYFVAVWIYLGGWLEEAVGGGAPVYDLAIWVRVAAQLYLVAVVVRDIVRPEHDPVRWTRRPCSVPRPATAGSAQLISTRSKSVAVNRTRHVDLVADLGHRRPGRDEQHRGLHVRRLGEQPLLAADGVRRAHQPGRVEPTARDRGGPRLQRWRRRSAPRGRCRARCRRRRRGSCRRAGPSGRGSRRCRRARPGGCRARSPAPTRAPRSPSQRAVPMRGRKVKSGYFARAASSSTSVRWETQTVRLPGWSSLSSPAATTSVISRSTSLRWEVPADLGRAAGAGRRPRPRRRRASATQPAASRRPRAVKPWRSIEVIRSSTTRGRSPGRRRRARPAPSRSSSRPTVWITRGSSGRRVERAATG